MFIHNREKNQQCVRGLCSGVKQLTEGIWWHGPSWYLGVVMEVDACVIGGLRLRPSISTCEDKNKKREGIQWFEMRTGRI